MKTEFLDMLLTRRSVRAYKPDPVPTALLEEVLRAGTYAPTGGGRQSPVLVAVTDKAARDEISRLNAAVMGKDTDPYYGAPVLVLALADPASSTWVEDASCALENMMLAAHALGLGSVWVHREREIFDSEAGKALLGAAGDAARRGVHRPGLCLRARACARAPQGWLHRPRLVPPRAV